MDKKTHDVLACFKRRLETRYGVRLKGVILFGPRAREALGPTATPTWPWFARRYWRARTYMLKSPCVFRRRKGQSWSIWRATVGGF